MKHFNVYVTIEGRPHLGMFIPVGADNLKDAIEIGVSYFCALHNLKNRRNITFIAGEI